jgi:integrase
MTTGSGGFGSSQRWRQAVASGRFSAFNSTSLRWDLNELHLSNRTTKGLRTRYVPLSQELGAMLELRRHDPDGDQFGPEAYVFGNEVGERLKNYQKAWSTLRRRALGHGPH